MPNSQPFERARAQTLLALTQNAKDPAQACLDPIQTVGLMGF